MPASPRMTRTSLCPPRTVSIEPVEHLALAGSAQQHRRGRDDHSRARLPWDHGRCRAIPLVRSRATYGGARWPALAGKMSRLRAAPRRGSFLGTTACSVAARMKPVVVAAVLERFGIAPPSRDLAGLCAVYAAWCRSVSFDNVLKMIHLAEQRPGSLPGSTAEGFFEDWLACGAGGTCWAGNGALHGLLEALGFDAQRAIATMMPSRSPAPNHGSVVVSVEGEQWIADASILTGVPIRIPAPGEPAGCTSLPRFEWLDGQPAVVWRTLSDARRLPVPHRADRRRPRRVGRLPPRKLAPGVPSTSSSVPE